MIAPLGDGLTLYGLCGAGLVGFGVYSVVVSPGLLRRILGFNLMGAGILLLFGVAARRGAAAGFQGDPTPHALIITGVVVAFSATALAVALVLRLRDAAAGAVPEGSGEQGQP